MTNTVQKLYSEFRSAIEHSPDSTLDFFTQNSILLKNIKSFQIGFELDLYIQLAWQHLNALYKKNRFNDTADNAIKYLQIVDGEIERLNLYSLKGNWYFGLLLMRL